MTNPQVSPARIPPGPEPASYECGEPNNSEELAFDLKGKATPTADQESERHRIRLNQSHSTKPASTTIYLNRSYHLPAGSPRHRFTAQFHPLNGMAAPACRSRRTSRAAWPILVNDRVVIGCTTAAQKRRQLVGTSGHQVTAARQPPRSRPPPRPGAAQDPWARAATRSREAGRPHEPQAPRTPPPRHGSRSNVRTCGDNISSGQSGAYSRERPPHARGSSERWLSGLVPDGDDDPLPAPRARTGQRHHRAGRLPAVEEQLRPEMRPERTADRIGVRSGAVHGGGRGRFRTYDPSLVRRVLSH